MRRVSAKAPEDQDESAKKAVSPLSCIEGCYCALDVKPLDDGLLVTSVADVLSPCRCQSQWCEDCRGAHAWAWRDRLRPVVQSWDACTMITLTIDPKKWRGPEEAYLAIQKKRSVARFVEKLYRRGLIESKEFFYAIEFHKNGWIHYHLAVRGVGVVDGPLVGLRLYPESDATAALWGHGIIQVSAPPESEDGGYDPEHAMNYLTKYIAKQDVGPPDWVLDRLGNFRKFSTSRGLAPGKKRNKSVPSDEPKIIAKRTPRERRELCARTSRLMEVVKKELHNETGVRELSRSYSFKFDVDEDFRELKSSRDAANTVEDVERWKLMQKLVDGREWADDGTCSVSQFRAERLKVSKRIMEKVAGIIAGSDVAPDHSGLSEDRRRRPRSGEWDPGWFPPTGSDLWVVAALKCG